MKFIASMCIISLAIAVPGVIERLATPVYRVVLDPGHGGMSSTNYKVHGDRFDMLSGQYLVPFAEGAAHRGLWEHILVYQIAEKTRRVLELCSPAGDFRRFEEILKKYTDESPRRIVIETTIIRGDSSNREGISKRPDPNAEFRLYDYPDRGGAMQPGRISRINSQKPHLVVSLHMTRDVSTAYRGMNPIITAPPALLNEGLHYLQGKRSDRSFFDNGRYTAWFQESSGRSTFGWFLNDTAFYFTGYPLTRGGQLDYNKYRGYRYNMVRWAYTDDAGWEKTARLHPDNTPYAKTIPALVPTGRFWERERSAFESYRRDGGPEGYGGDNLYATVEIMRYILRALHLRNEDHPHQRITEPYISTWSVPLLVNAVAAFIELGSLANIRHRYILVHKQEEIAEGIAVGIYSLLAGIKPRKASIPHAPNGTKLDLERYQMPDGRSYFDAVVK